jgi:hypothetical protein
LTKKGWKNVCLKEQTIADAREHLKEKEKGKVFPRSLPRFITEAIENQIEKEKSDLGEARQKRI